MTRPQAMKKPHMSSRFTTDKLQSLVQILADEQLDVYRMRGNTGNTYLGNVTTKARRATETNPQNAPHHAPIWTGGRVRRIVRDIDTKAVLAETIQTPGDFTLSRDMPLNAVIDYECLEPGCEWYCASFFGYVPTEASFEIAPANTILTQRPPADGVSFLIVAQGVVRLEGTGRRTFPKPIVFRTDQDAAQEVKTVSSCIVLRYLCMKENFDAPEWRRKLAAQR